ncbi:MAG: hypothetical protein FJY98_03830 [Candidatus Liptonbacteria bacterium]|nr:hypothetical protein [Candidatus Liptonbacteria bacterium]
MRKQELYNYFTKGILGGPILIGTEVETHFVDAHGDPISLTTSQKMFRILVDRGWNISATKGNIITELKTKTERYKILYELGRQNLELSVAPMPEDIWRTTCFGLEELYIAAAECHASPFFGPILETDEELLVIPDERDASWLALDGREALNLLARTASVQFSIDTWGPNHAIQIMKRLASVRSQLLIKNPYPQEELWRKYIASSHAGYRPDRYGVHVPDSMEHYVELLAQHDVVVHGKLIPFSEAEQNIDLFLRSVWWNFRLRRWNHRLCIEVRTFARRSDEQGSHDLENLISSLQSCYMVSEGHC